MEDRRWVWEELLEEVEARGEAEPAGDAEDARNPTAWVVDCLMGCYNFIDAEIE